MNSVDERISLCPLSIVYVVDDDDSVRYALDGLFRSAGLQVRAFSTPDEMLDRELPDVPSCLVLDVCLDGLSGLDFQAQLTSMQSSLPIIFISGHGNIAMSVQAMKAGALDFLSKPLRDIDLLEAVNSALRVNQATREKAKTHTCLKIRFDSLTHREQQVMALAASGMMNKNIAAHLKLSEITVKIYRRGAMTKMDADTFADLVKMANDLRLPNT